MFNYPPLGIWTCSSWHSQLINASNQLNQSITAITQTSLIDIGISLIGNPTTKIFNTQSWNTYKAEFVRSSTMVTFRGRSNDPNGIQKSMLNADTKYWLTPESNCTTTCNEMARNLHTINNVWCHSCILCCEMEGFSSGLWSLGPP